MNTLKPIYRLHLFHFGLVFTLLFSVCLAFYMQFKFDFLQEQILSSKNQIVEYQDQIRLLEVEWVYLTRPERLRTLSERYLQNNGYISSIQIKDTTRLERYYVASLEKQLKKKQNLAMNEVKQKIN